MFRQLVLARIIEPTSKLDSLRVLDEAGMSPASISAGSAIQGDGPAPPAACGRGLLARRGDGRSECRHLPLTWFIDAAPFRQPPRLDRHAGP